MATYTVADTRRSILTALQTMYHRDNDSGARIADGMTESDSSSVNIDLSRIQTQNFLGDAYNGGKGFVDFKA